MRSIIALAGLALWFGAYYMVSLALYKRRRRKRLEARLARQLAIDACEVCQWCLRKAGLPCGVHSTWEEKDRAVAWSRSQRK